MASSKTLNPTNVTIQIPALTDAPNVSVLSNCIDKEADAINTLNSNLAAMYAFSAQSGYTTSQTIEAFLDTLPTTKPWFTAITSNSSTGDLVTLSGQNLFYIMQIATGNANQRVQIAIAVNTARMYIRTKFWWGTWSSWTAQ